MTGTFTIDVENQVILDPGTDSEINLTQKGLECLACARSFPSCGSIRPGADCPVFIPSLELRLIEPKGPGPVLIST